MKTFFDKLASLSTFAAVVCLVLAVVAVPSNAYANEDDPIGQSCPCGMLTGQALQNCLAENQAACAIGGNAACAINH